MRPIGTAPELERRRTRAVELLNQGESPSVMASKVAAFIEDRSDAARAR